MFNALSRQNFHRVVLLSTQTPATLFKRTHRSQMTTSGNVIKDFSEEKSDADEDGGCGRPHNTGLRELGWATVTGHESADGDQYY